MKNENEQTGNNPSSAKGVNHLGNITGILGVGLAIGLINSIFSVGEIDGASTFIGLTIGYGFTSMALGIILGVIFAGINSLIKKRKFSEVVYKMIWVAIFIISFPLVLRLIKVAV